MMATFMACQLLAAEKAERIVDATGNGRRPRRAGVRLMRNRNAVPPLQGSEAMAQASISESPRRAATSPTGHAVQAHEDQSEAAMDKDEPVAAAARLMATAVTTASAQDGHNPHAVPQGPDPGEDKGAPGEALGQENGIGGRLRHSAFAYME